jgi:phage terminase small subunit
MNVAVLGNSKHEAFAQGIARGELPQAAYEAVPGWRARGESARTSAERLLRKATVVARVWELKDEAAARNVITVDRTLEEYRRLAFANLKDVFGEDGRLPPLVELPSEVVAALGDYYETEVVTENTDGTRKRRIKRRVKLGDKMAALKFLARYLGMDGEGLQTKEPLAERVKRLAAQKRAAKEQQ